MGLRGKKKPKNNISLGEKLYKDLNNNQKKFYKLFGEKLGDSKEDKAIFEYLKNREKKKININMIPINPTNYKKEQNI